MYWYDGTDWQLGGYKADKANLERDLKIQVEEKIPGARQDIGLTFIADGSDFIVNNPFDGVLRVGYGNTATDTELYQRYFVRVPLANFDDAKAPAKLKLDGKTYALGYFESDSEGFATYRTAVTQGTANRLSAVGPVANCNLQTEDGTWLAHSEDMFNRRTIDKDDLAALAQRVPAVHQLPNTPVEGQKVEILNDLAVPNPAIMTPEQGTAGGRNFVGYLKGSPDVGTLVPASDKVDSIAAYWGGSGNINNRITVRRPSGVTDTPAFLEVNGERFSLEAAGAGFTHYWVVAGSANQTEDFVRHFFTDGKPVSVNVIFSDNSKAWADSNFTSGSILVWDGMKWLVDTTSRRTDAEVNALIDVKVAANNMLLNLKTIWTGTQAQYDAITTKDPNTIYFVRS